VVLRGCGYPSVPRGVCGVPLGPEGRISVGVRGVARGRAAGGQGAAPAREPPTLQTQPRAVQPGSRSTLSQRAATATPRHVGEVTPRRRRLTSGRLLALVTRLELCMIGLRTRHLLRRTLLALGHHPGRSKGRRVCMDSACRAAAGQQLAGPARRGGAPPLARAHRPDLVRTKPSAALPERSSHDRISDDGRRLEVEWKVALPGTLDGWNNNPRKELATYSVQRWFLEPQTTSCRPIALRAVPLAAYRRLEPHATPTVDGTQCIVGMVALWLRHPPRSLTWSATMPASPRTPTTRTTSRTSTSWPISSHTETDAPEHPRRDSDTNRRVFAVDNGISFGDSSTTS